MKQQWKKISYYPSTTTTYIAKIWFFGLPSINVYNIICICPSLYYIIVLGTLHRGDPQNRRVKIKYA